MDIINQNFSVACVSMYTVYMCEYLCGTELVAMGYCSNGEGMNSQSGDDVDLAI
jgi:hypothetical protein